MSTKSLPQPSARTFNVADLVGLAAEGKVRIPKFQRPLRWKWEDVRRLFDSISKGYPVGSLLLWKRPADAGVVRLGAQTIHSPAHAESLWVVDGQQRLTSLANALTDAGGGSEDFGISYDLDKEEFVRPSKTEVSTIVPLPVLFDLQRLVDWAQEHELGPKLKQASAVTSAIRQFTIPAYIVEQQDEAVLRDIFDRMNNYGKRLSRAEVFAALHPGTQGVAADAAGFQRIVDEIGSELHFGQCDDDTVLRAFLARRGPDVYREIRDEFGNTRTERDFGNESEEAAYAGVGLALKKAVSFLQNVGVPHLAFLPYRHLLLVLTRFFAHFPDPDPRNLHLVQRWFWRATLISPNAYGGWNPAVKLFCSLVRAGEETESVQRLLQATEAKKGEVRRPDLKKFRTNQADSRVALCALWAMTPISPLTWQPYSRQELAEELGADASPRQVVSRLMTPTPNHLTRWLAANHIHIVDESGTRGSALFECREEATYETFLRSHVLTSSLVQRLRRIDEARATDLEAERLAFVTERHSLIETIVDEFIGRNAQWEFEDTPPLASFDLDDEDEDAA